MAGWRNYDMRLATAILLTLFTVGCGMSGETYNFYVQNTGNGCVVKEHVIGAHADDTVTAPMSIQDANELAEQLNKLIEGKQAELMARKKSNDQ